jgi:hypothetical protein
VGAFVGKLRLIEAAPAPEVIEAVQAAVEAEEGIWDEVTCGDVRRSPMFEFARCLRADPCFSGLAGDAALTLIQKALQKSCDATLADQLSPPHDDPEISFLVAWDLVVGPGVFEQAVALAKSKPASKEKSVSSKFGLFVEICANLQRLSGAAPIIVPVRKFAGVVGVSAVTISTYRQLAVRRGILKLVKKHSREDRQATKFRFVGGNDLYIQKQQ